MRHVETDHVGAADVAGTRGACADLRGRAWTVCRLVDDF